MAAYSDSQYREIYECKDGFAFRNIVFPSGNKISTKIPALLDPTMNDAQSVFDYSFLRLKKRPNVDFSDTVPSVDLFSGCGCLSLGAMEALSAIGKRFVPLLAIDKDPNAIAVYNDNFKPAKFYSNDITRLIDGMIGEDETANERLLRDHYLNNITPKLVLAGPPCQGYSSLNNFHRQSDKRNVLYERVARFVELFSPSNVIIENVPTVIHSTDNVVIRTTKLMESKGYFVDSAVVNLSCLGVPQIRKRHVVVASKERSISIKSAVEKHHVEKKRTFEWAASDLSNDSPDGLLSTSSKHSEDNKRRIQYLHLHNLYDLPNDQRPVCHHRKHGYKSMYGRIKADQPAQTITRGFTSPGQGRYIHPTQTRTITPHEAARLQFIPDYFDFSAVKKRHSLALMIGNAAPMKLSYVFCIELFN